MATYQNGDQLRDAAKASFGADQDGSDDALILDGAGLIMRRTVQLVAAGTAGTAGPSTPLGSLPRASRVIAARVINGPTAITGDPTNNATITVNQHAAAGGAATSAVAALTTTATLAAQQTTSLTVTSANASVAAGGSLHAIVTKNASGVATGVLTVEVDIYVMA